MRLTKRQLKRIIREEKRRLDESGDITPTHPFPMATIPADDTTLSMINLIADILLNGTGLDPVACESSAEEIVNQLQKAGYC